ncbi:glutamate 5-kinase [Pseudogracilibacillus auburnensis]|uniref:Glutamate 5-kinase n=1 Tax=Pseudogracilibacillus auburnensis TaxID=1494959 RepID=A0A2V3W0M7_9BACI|nr:glutamate 5-kinase [Pseudogracilibacillus auburnensis]MBO1002655.1 glutamate 5-kinase [Pseudogracilibacillus auburnensis]PXW86691.1 glutamate 5-kinase [Pseudogracilibacillus auburnensis]
MKKQTIVVKIGSSSLTNDNGEIDEAKLTGHVDAIAALKKANHTVILVSSGAVAAGFKQLGYPFRPVTIKGRQAAAAVGQSLLIQSYIKKFQEHKIVPAQILLTRSDFSDRERYRNAFSTIMELLDRGIIPIINENDSVSIDELTFGDNDMLSALVSGFIHADQLIILTDINGLYTDNPVKNPQAKKYNFLEEITDDILAAASSDGSKLGTGGMKSKLEAAKTALSLGVSIFIGKGEGKDSLLHILQGTGDGTYITNKALEPINTSRQWIALHSESVGKIYVDEGAEEAILYKGRSLLPAGIFKVKGSFEKGDVVEVYGKNGLLGKGEVNYSSSEVEQEMKKRLEKKKFEPSIEVIHRNRWVEIK